MVEDFKLDRVVKEEVSAEIKVGSEGEIATLRQLVDN